MKKLKLVIILTMILCLCACGKKSSKGNTYKDMSGAKLIQYELDNWGENGYVGDLKNTQYDLTTYTDYVVWLDDKLANNEKFRKEYSQNLIKRGSWEYANTGNLVKTSHDYDDIDVSAYTYKIEGTETKDGTLIINITMDFNVYELLDNDEPALCALTNKILADYTNIRMSGFNGYSYSSSNLDAWLKNPLNNFGWLSAEIEDNISHVQIGLYRGN